MNKTPEGKKLIQENVKKIVFAGPAINEKELQEIKDIIGEDKINIQVNQNDIVNILVAKNKITTSDENEYHGSKNYNYHSQKNNDGYYEKPEKIKNVTGKVEKINGQHTRSIIQRMKENIFNKKKGE